MAKSDGVPTAARNIRTALADHHPQQAEKPKDPTPPNRAQTTPPGAPTAPIHCHKPWTTQRNNGHTPSKSAQDAQDG